MELQTTEIGFPEDHVSSGITLLLIFFPSPNLQGFPSLELAAQFVATLLQLEHY